VQVRVQLDCTGLSWGVLAVLVGGNRLQLFRYDRHPGAIAAIRARAVEFMELVRRQESPPIEWERDADVVRSVNRWVAPGKTIEGDAELQAVAERYRELGLIKSAAEKDRKVLSAQILASIGDAEIALLPNGRRVTASEVGPTFVEAHVREKYRPVYVREPKKEKRGKR
jgi:hypothetical protein